jgi:phage/plasmid-associated DNA primase
MHRSDEPEFKLFLGTNHTPLIRGTDNGIWRRVHLIPFDVQIPDEERDMRLPEKLGAELPGILAWVVAGAVERCLALSNPTESSLANKTVELTRAGGAFRPAPRGRAGGPPASCAGAASR